MIAKKQKISPISLNQKIDYKDIDLLTLFVTEQGKILQRQILFQSLELKTRVRS